MGLLFKLPAKPISELEAMIIKEVATAFFIGNFAEKINVGIIKKPPPTPTKPVIYLFVFVQLKSCCLI